MREVFEDAKAKIEHLLTLNVLRGELDEHVAQVWKEAVGSLEDYDFAHLMRLCRNLPRAKVTSAIIRFLMERHYPFRELVIYNTDADFKRRMGLEDFDTVY